MSDFINSISISENDIKSFRTEGAIILRDLITSEAIEKIRKTFEEIALPSPLGFTARYTRMCYNLEDYTSVFDSITSSDIFGDIMKQLTGNKLILAQALGLETEPNPEVAVKWHYDQTSYGYVSTNVPVFGLWLPLVNISKSLQRGGIVWVPKNIMSAKNKLSQWEDYYLSLYDLKIEGGDKYQALNKEFNYTKTYGLDWLSDDDFKILDANAIEPDLNIGDAVLMDRNVYHKTAPHLDGLINKRLVCVMRFVDGNARLNRKLFEGLNIHARIENRVLPIIFISKLIDIADGEKIASSKYSPKPFPIG